MNKIFRTVMLVLVTAVLLAACGQSDEEKQAAADAAAKAAANAPVPLPAAGADDAAWQKYLVSVVTRNMQGVKTNHPFMYYVPAGDSMAAEDARKSQLDNVGATVARGVLPGNMLAFGGPDSKATADLIVEAFANANDGSFKNVVVLFAGAAADQQRVQDAIAKSGAELRFVEMK
ncbi:MAG TPA: hypothetical protein PKD77_06165 [Rudaea sp.]|jgi:predicted small lipoprotein YifL|nr:hypothetical protein [Rudaea sp.]